VNLLEVSAEAGDPGPVIVLAGDADGSPATELDEALTAQVSPRATHLTIDVTNLRSLDRATAQTLMTAALIVMVQGGSTVLVNPHEPVLKMLSHTRTAEMFTIQARTPARTPADHRRPAPVTDHEHELDGPVTLRRQPARLSTGHAGSGTRTFEIICRQCGDDPGLDYRQLSPGLRQIRGPYLLKAGIEAFLEHQDHHDGAG
jgi:anti-anti-sigma factor